MSKKEKNIYSSNQVELNNHPKFLNYNYNSNVVLHHDGPNVVSYCPNTHETSCNDFGLGVFWFFNSCKAG